MLGTTATGLKSKLQNPITLSRVIISKRLHPNVKTSIANNLLGKLVEHTAQCLILLSARKHDLTVAKIQLGWCVALEWDFVTIRVVYRQNDISHNRQKATGKKNQRRNSLMFN